jgi:S1-C subfamily serine protease
VRSLVRALLVAGAVLPRAASADVISLQEVLLRAKPAAVLVVAEVSSEVTVNCGSGARTVTPSPFRETGTGWFVDSNGWIVTNAHVVQPAHEPPPWLLNEQAQRGVLAACVADELAKQGLTPGQRPDVEERMKRDALARALPSARVEMKPSLFIIASNGFRLAAKVAKYSPPVSTQTGAKAMSGRDLALLQVEASEMPALKPSTSRIKIGDPIHVLGFPGVVLTHELLNASSKVEASVTNGAVSGFKEDVQGQPVIQTDASAAWGNSGGPAIDDLGDVVGVLTFVTLSPGGEGSIVQGFNFVIPADAVRTFLAGTPVDLAEVGPFNKAWFDGLRRYFTGDWTTAAESMRVANRLQPDFPDVKRMLADADAKVKNPPPRPFPWAMATIAVSALAVAGAGLVGVRYVRGNRFRVRPSEVARLLDSGSPPLLVDARAGITYAASQFRIPGAIHLAPEDLDAGTTSLTADHARTVVAYCT